MMGNDQMRRLDALRLALSVAEPGEDKAATLNRAEAFDLFLKGWEVTNGNAA
jgi:hypothetical protein